MKNREILQRVFNEGYHSDAISAFDREEAFNKVIGEITIGMSDAPNMTTLKGLDKDQNEVLEKALAFRLACELRNYPRCTISGVIYMGAEKTDVEKAYIEGKEYERQRLANIMGLGELK